MINILIEEANKKSFSQIARIADENGAAVILENGRQYIVFEYDEKDEYIDSATFRRIAKNVLTKHLEAFKELAK